MTENTVNESRPTPPGFPEMVREFTDAAIKASPTNMHQFAVDYFTQLRDSQPLRVIPEDDDVTLQQNGVRFQESTEASGSPSGLASEKQAGPYIIVQFLGYFIHRIYEFVFCIPI